MGVADRMASRPRSICDCTTWLVLLNDKVTRIAQVSLYCYCRPADGILDSKGPLSHMIAPSILAEINKEVKLVASGQKKRQDLYESYLPFIPEKKV